MRSATESEERADTYTVHAVYAQQFAFRRDIFWGSGGFHLTQTAEQANLTALPESWEMRYPAGFLW
jgi:hypothetical protein